MPCHPGPRLPSIADRSQAHTFGRTSQPEGPMVQHPGRHPVRAAPSRELHYTGRLLGMQYEFGLSISDAALPLARLAKRSAEAGDRPATAACEALRRWESEGGRIG
jgi:hypothetical protein